MKLGIIGAGMIVSSFLPEILQVEEIQVMSLYARRIEAAKALCQQYHIPLATDNIDTLYSSGIDTVYVAVSNIAHYAFCKAAPTGMVDISPQPLAPKAGPSFSRYTRRTSISGTMSARGRPRVP